MVPEQRGPDRVGILAIEIYFPSQYVAQTDLEKFCGEFAGKYTEGLGQTSMSFCSDCEDIYSICLTVTQRLIDRHGINPSSIGRLEVGTETMLDKSKSVKTVLMQIFETCGNCDMEGVDNKNACFGGTQALFNAINWIESSSWDGRDAIVVAGDIAVYSDGPARATGGCGAVAILVGPNAPIIFDRGVRATYFKHVYDFYKPKPDSEYPIVDGTLSIVSYLSALDQCYELYCKKAQRVLAKCSVTLADFDALVFHTPYAKLVQKAVARLVFLDSLRNDSVAYADLSSVKSYKTSDPQTTYLDKAQEKVFMELSKAVFKCKTESTLLLGKQNGNMYTASVYAAIISYLISNPLEKLSGSRIGIYSYGSGLSAAMFSAVIDDTDPNCRKTLASLVTSLAETHERLAQRRQASPEEFVAAMKLREHVYLRAPFTPQANVSELFPGTYYVDHVDEKYRRFYKQVPTRKYAENGKQCVDGIIESN